MTGYGYGFDWTYLLVIVASILSMVASYKVQSTYNKYAKVRSNSGLTGAETAKRILQANGIMDVSVQHVSGTLTDHYDPRTKTVNLSDAVYGSSSVAAVGVAAHECGHVIQHHTGYLPLQLRTSLVPVANIGSAAGWPLVLLGVFLSIGPLITVGIWVFSAAVLFQIVTLPVELDASRRALVELESGGILERQEVRSSRKVLSAAAMTYVASAAVAVLQLLRLILLFGRRRD